MDSLTRVKSFTLIELMVVIAIVSLLVALIAPALKNAKERAKTIQCINNLHQIAIAVDLYGQDTGLYPFPDVFLTFPIPPAQAPSTWSYSLSRYLGKEGASKAAGPNSRSPVLMCPSSLKISSNLVCAYGLNNWMCNENDFSMGPGVLKNIPYPYLTRTSQIILAADGNQVDVNKPQGGEAKSTFVCGSQFLDPNTVDQPVTVGDNLDWPPGVPQQIRFRHNGDIFANVLFVDGRVSTLKPNEIFSRNVLMEWDWWLRSWNN